MASIKFPGSVVPGAIDAFGAAYDKGVSANATARGALVNEALGLERLEAASREGAMRRALPGDIAALATAKFGGAPPAGPSVVPAPDMVAAVPPPTALSPMDAPDGSVTNAGLAGVMPQAAPAQPSLAPPEMLTASAGSPAVTLPMLAQHPEIGAERAARLLHTPEGQAALKSRGFVSEEEFEKRQLRKRALEEARKKYAEAEQMIRSGKPDDVVQALNIEAQAHTLLAQAVDHPERLLAKADDLRKKFTDIALRKDERTKVARDLPRIYAALDEYKSALQDPQADKAAASTTLYEVLASAESEIGQRRADDLIGKLTTGAIEDMKASPIRAFDAAVAKVIAQRRDKGGNLDMAAIYREAAQQDPHAFAQYLSYVTQHAKDVPKPLLGLFGISSATSEEFLLAENIAAQVERLTPGTGQYYARVREIVKELRHEKNPQFAAEARKTASQERDADVRLHKQLQDQVKDAQRAIKDAGGSELATQEQRDDLASARARLRAHEASMVDKKILSPGVGEAGKDREAREVPKSGQTRENTKAEYERLLAVGNSPDDAKEKMRRKGWK